MAKITIQGWKYGFQKISFTHLLQSRAGYTLSEAKHLTDDVLAGRTITVSVPEELCSSLASEMEQIGAILGPNHADSPSS